MDEPLLEHRRHLVESLQQAYTDYDKIVVTLSGGALGLSFFFISDVISQAVNHAWWLIGAWLSWTTSISIIGASFISSQKAIEKAIEDIDESLKETDEEESDEDVEQPSRKPGGRYRTLTLALNYSAGMFFVLGVLLISVFVYQNMG